MDEDYSEYRRIFDAAVDGLIVSDAASGRILLANSAACRMHGYTREQLIGSKVTLLIHPESRQQFNENLRSFELGGGFDTWARLLRRDSSTSYSRWRGARLDYEGRACMLWSVRDVSERIQAEQNLRQRMKAHTREQSALLGISQTLGSTLEVDPGLILDQFRDLVPYDRGAFFGMEGTALVARAIRGTTQYEPSSPIRLSIEEPDTLASLLNAGKPIRIADLRGRSRQAVFLRSLFANEAFVLVNGMQSGMWVPFAVRDGIIGGLAVTHAKRSVYSPRHAHLALSVANQAVMTMVNAELYRKAQTTAAAEERQRLAQSLHDAVNQSLFSAGLIAEVLPRLWEQNPDLAQKSLEDMRRLMRGAYAEMRALLAELRPATITDAELGTLLNLLGDAFTGRTNIPVTLTVLGEGSLPPEVQIAVYRICQESLNNIAKHANASQVDINLSYQGRSIDLAICDNGRGYDTEKTVPAHYGVSMMYERASAIRATLSITSQPGRGTEVRICWPGVRSTEVV